MVATYACRINCRDARSIFARSICWCTCVRPRSCARVVLPEGQDNVNVGSYGQRNHFDVLTLTPPWSPVTGMRLLKIDEYAVGSERYVESLASRLQLHSDPFVVTKPERPFSLIAQGPSCANLKIGTGEIFLSR
jgi:hypothetical protein